MVDHHWQLDGSAPELYQKYLVSAITTKWADGLVGRAQPSAGEEVARRRLRQAAKSGGPTPRETHCTRERVPAENDSINSALIPIPVVQARRNRRGQRCGEG